MGIIEKIEQYEADHPHTSGTCKEIKDELFALVCFNKPDTIIEIGVSAGAVTAYLAGALKSIGSGKLISVDNWSQNFGGKAGGPGRALARIEDLELKDWVTFVSQNSQTYLQAQEDDSAEMVWIDGDHSYEGAKADIVEALRISNTIVGVHDTSHHHHREDIRGILRELGVEDQGYYFEERHGCWIGEV